MLMGFAEVNMEEPASFLGEPGKKKKRSNSLGLPSYVLVKEAATAAVADLQSDSKQKLGFKRQDTQH